MSKREMVQRERRAFKKGIFVAFGMCSLATMVFFFATGSGSTACICALGTMAAACFKG